MDSAARPWGASYAPGIPRSFDVPDGTLSDLFDSPVRAHGMATVLESCGATATYRTPDTAVARTVAGLRSLGVTAGDRRTLVLPACPQNILAFHSDSRRGALAAARVPRTFVLAEGLRWSLVGRVLGRGVCIQLLDDGLRAEGTGDDR